MPKRPIDLFRKAPAAPELLLRLQAAEKYAQSHGLSAHVNALGKRGHGFSRWLGAAIVVGAITAFAVVSFFAH